MTAGCGRSTAPARPQSAAIPAHLLVKRNPADVPAIPRTVDPATGKSASSGADLLTGTTSLYDYIGEVVGQLNALIDAVTVRDAEPPKR